MWVLTINVGPIHSFILFSLYTCSCLQKHAFHVLICSLCTHILYDTSRSHLARTLSMVPIDWCFPSVSWYVFYAFSWHAEYRTVSGVAGPLVILDKVKVKSEWCFFWRNFIIYFQIVIMSKSMIWPDNNVHGGLYLTWSFTFMNAMPWS